MQSCERTSNCSQKRVRPAPMGRAFRVLKRTAHLTVQVAERPEKVVAVGAAGDDAPKRRGARKAQGAGRASAKSSAKQAKE